MLGFPSALDDKMRVKMTMVSIGKEMTYSLTGLPNPRRGLVSLTYVLIL
jgi:hypothetical protein